MNKPLIILYCLALTLPCASLLRAQTVADKPTCAVLTFDAQEGVTPGECKTLSDRFRAELNRLGAYRLLSREKMEEILKAQKYSISENCSAMACAIEVGKLLPIEYIVFGSIGKVGQTYTVNANLANVESGEMERSATYDLKGEIDDMLTMGVGALARKLVGGAAGRSDAGTGALPVGGAGLDDLVEEVREKEDEQKRLESERIEAQQRLAAEMQRRKAEFEKDYAAYRMVIGSKNADEAMKREAWKRLATAWGVKDAGAEPGGIRWDEATGLLVPTGLAPSQGEGLVVDLGAGVKMEFMWIAPGEFMMGSPDSESNRYSDEGPQHWVTISKGFWIGKYEVTQRQWEQVMGSNPSHFKNAGLDAPVEQVSWNDCQDFIGKLNASGFVRELRRDDGSLFRLPSEAQWEYACRAGTATRFYTGDQDSDLDRAGWYSGNSGKTTHTVGQKAANAWGLYDMHGNVWEWCEDWYGGYGSGSAVDPVGPSSGSVQVLRGGSCSHSAGLCRSAYRRRPYPSFPWYIYGVRVALFPGRAE